MEIDPISCFGNNIPFFLLSYSILGAGLKYIDVAFDEKVVNRAVTLIIPLSICKLWVCITIIDVILIIILFVKKLKKTNRPIGTIWD